jgi:branched-chain amino acid transport system ATP-binding protein
VSDLLTVEGLSVNYGPVPAVRDVSLRLGEGEIVGIVGANGAGKTTTLAAISGLVRPGKGRITLAGREIQQMTPENIVRRGLALVPEGRRIFPSLTVMENLRVAATLQRGRQRARQECDRVLETFPALVPLLHATAGNLSGGEQQQLAIARALILRPRVLLVDEPSLGLAPLIVDRVFDVLAELRQQRVTVLLVEQNAMKTIELADRLYVLRTGKIEELDKRAENLVSQIVSGELYFGTAE